MYGTHIIARNDTLLKDILPSSCCTPDGDWTSPRDDANALRLRLPCDPDDVIIKEDVKFRDMSITLLAPDNNLCPIVAAAANYVP